MVYNKYGDDIMRRRFGDRKDGYKLRKADPFFRIIPYLMKSFIKNEEIVLRSSTDFRRDFLYIEEAAKINNIIFDFMEKQSDSKTKY